MKYVEKIKNQEMRSKDVIFEPKYIKVNNVVVKSDVVNLSRYEGEVAGLIHPVSTVNDKCSAYINILNIQEEIEELRVKTIKEDTHQNITKDVMENDIVLLRRGRHNNVIVNEDSPDRVFMNDVREIRKITKDVFIFVQHDYPDRPKSEAIIANVRDVKIELVYWKPAGFDWE